MTPGQFEIIDHPRKNRISFTLFFTVFLTCFGSSMLYGYNLAVINLPADRIKCFLNETILQVPCKESYNTSGQKYNFTLAADIKLGIFDVNFFYALTNTIFVIAGIIGALSTGWIGDYFGRRNGLLLNHSFIIIGAIISGLTVKTRIVWLLFVGRFLMGINSGVTIGLASIYLTEIAPQAYRGAIGACHTLAVTIGIVIGYIFTMSYTLNTDTMWPVACGIVGVPALISLILLPLCPESARYIYFKTLDENLTRKEFHRMNKIESVDNFIKELKTEMEMKEKQRQFKFREIFTKDLRLPLTIACCMQIMQQLSGINAVISYSSSMLNTAGISTNDSQYCIISIGLIDVVCTLISLPLLEKYGRRSLLLWPTALIAVSLLTLTITVSLVDSNILQSMRLRTIVGGLSVVSIMTYIIGFAFGLGPIPTLIVAEIFRQEPRGSAYSFSQAIQWISTLIVLIGYPNLNVEIGGFSFLPFLFVVIILWIFFFLYMPETKNRKIDEIAQELTDFSTVFTKKKIKQSESNIVDSQISSL